MKDEKIAESVNGQEKGDGPGSVEGTGEAREGTGGEKIAGVMSDTGVGAAGPKLVMVKPKERIEIPNLSGVGDLRIAPDGSRAYAIAHGSAMDLGAMLNATVEWWSSAIGLVILLGALQRIVRVHRRPERKGEPHCRRCGYNLAGVVGVDEGAARDARYWREYRWEGPCAECGTELGRKKRRPVIGRTGWRRSRLAWMLAAMSVGSVVFVWGWMLNPRLKLFEEGAWFSMGLYDWMSAREADGWWKMPSGWTQPSISSLVEIEPASGKWRRILVARFGSWRIAGITSDGRSLLLAEWDWATRRQAIVEMSVESREEVRRVDLMDVYELWYGASMLVGEVKRGDGSQDRMLSLRDVQHGGWALVKWNTGTNQATALIRNTLDVTRGDKKNQMLWSLGYAMAPGESTENGRVKYVCYPSPYYTQDNRKLNLRWYDEDGELVKETAMGGRVVCGEKGPVFSNDGEVFYLGANPLQPKFTGQIKGYRTKDVLGHEGPGVAARWGEISLSGFNGVLQVAGNGRYLIAGAGMGVFIRDTEQKEWTAGLAGERGEYFQEIAASADGRWVIGTSFDMNLSKGVVAPRQRVVVWRVPEEVIGEGAGQE